MAEDTQTQVNDTQDEAPAGHPEAAHLGQPRKGQVKTEGEAKKLAKELNKQVPIPGHAEGYVAYPDGKTVGPPQRS